MLHKIIRWVVAAALLVAPPALASQSNLVLPIVGPMPMSTFVGTYLNPAVLSLGSCNSGATAPTNGPGGVPFLYQCWIDTSGAPVSQSKIWDGTQWVSGWSVNTTTHALILNANSLVLAGGTVTASAPVLDLSQTWNNAGVTFTGVKLNVTSTASAAASLLLDLQVGGVSQVSVTKAGVGTFASLYADTIGKLSGNLALVATGGGRILVTAASGMNLSETPLQFSDGTTTVDVGLYREAPGILGQRSGTTAQAFRLYLSYTDVSNYSRFAFRWSGNDLYMGMENAGTGAAANTFFTGNALLFNSPIYINGGLNIDSNALFSSDNTHNIGAVAATRPKDLYLGGRIVAGGGTALTASAPFAFTQTWNNGAVDFDAFTIDVTSTASTASSNLFLIRLGGVDKLQVNRAGAMEVASSLTVAASIQIDGSFTSTSVDAALIMGGSNVVKLFPAPAGTPNRLEQRNGTAAQTLRVYGQWIDAANGDWLNITKSAGGAAIIATDKNGTGVASDLQLSPASGNTVVSGNVDISSFFRASGLGMFLKSDTARIWFGSGDDVVISRVGAGNLALDPVGGMINLFGVAAGDVAFKQTSTFLELRKGDDSDYARLDVKMLVADQGSLIGWQGFGGMVAYADGRFLLTDNNFTDFARLMFGGTTNAFGGLARDGAGIKVIAADGTTGAFLSGVEQTAPAAPAANGYRIFAQDNGGGKTQLMVIFASGAAQQIAIEP